MVSQRESARSTPPWSHMLIMSSKGRAPLQRARMGRGSPSLECWCSRAPVCHHACRVPCGGIGGAAHGAQIHTCASWAVSVLVCCGDRDAHREGGERRAASGASESVSVGGVSLCDSACPCLLRVGVTLVTRRCGAREAECVPGLPCARGPRRCPLLLTATPMQHPACASH